MCTVTVVPRSRGFRVVCNRDELRTRPSASPPELHRVAGTKAVWPVDPASGGTWIGANDAGLAMVLLNRTPPAGSVRPFSALAGRRRSRGTIIPELVRRRRIDLALHAACDLEACDFEPFTLVVLQGTVFAALTNAGGRMSLRAAALLRPILYTSSSLGDHLVCEPRRALFTQMVESKPEPLNLHAQAAFHCHRWRSRPSISVLMRRRDAATVSQTVVDVASTGVRMQYVPLVQSA